MEAAVETTHPEHDPRTLELTSDTRHEEATDGYLAKRKQANAYKAAAETKYVTRKMENMGLSTSAHFPYVLINEAYKKYKTMLETQDHTQAIKDFKRYFPKAEELRGKRITKFVTVQDLGPKIYRDDNIESMLEKEEEGIFDGPAATQMKSDMRKFMNTCSEATVDTAIHYLFGAGGDVQRAADRYFHDKESRTGKGMSSGMASSSFEDSQVVDEFKSPPEPQQESSYSFDDLMQLLGSIERLGEHDLSIEVKNSIILIVLEHFESVIHLDWRIIIDFLNSSSSSGKLTQRDIDTLYQSISREASANHLQV